MAPLGMVSMLGWYSSPEVGIISLIAFLVLSIVLVAICTQCRRKSGNAYDVSGTTTDGAGGANGTVGTKTVDTTYAGTLSWRNHNDMPVNTLDRTRAVTN